jgi:hypothetical protein
LRERRLPEVCQGGTLVLDEPGDGVGDDVHLKINSNTFLGDGLYFVHFFTVYLNTTASIKELKNDLTLTYVTHFKI